MKIENTVIRPLNRKGIRQGINLTFSSGFTLIIEDLHDKEGPSLT